MLQVPSASKKMPEAMSNWPQKKVSEIWPQKWAQEWDQ